MSFGSWKSLSAIVCTLGAAFYQSSYMPFGITYVISLILLASFSTGTIFLFKKLSAKFSSQTVFLLLVSFVVGFGSATFLSICCRILFPSIFIPFFLQSFINFLLPLACTASCFFGLNGSSWFRKARVHSIDTDQENSICAAKKFIPDVSILEDGRIVDLVRLGLFEGQLFVPSFLSKELKIQSENSDDFVRNRARKALDSLKRLETVSQYGIQHKDVYAPDALELSEKILFLSKAEQMTILTNESAMRVEDQNQGQFLSIETIASALKPPIPKGENLSIKIQRLGKEPRQGIGYLEDGTMVVVNGGGDYLGRMVRTQVLSQKYSTSGKIVFCNVREEDDDRFFVSTVTSITESS